VSWDHCHHDLPVPSPDMTCAQSSRALSLWSLEHCGRIGWPLTTVHPSPIICRFDWSALLSFTIILTYQSVLQFWVFYVGRYWGPETYYQTPSDFSSEFNQASVSNSGCLSTALHCFLSLYSVKSCKFWQVLIVPLMDTTMIPNPNHLYIDLSEFFAPHWSFGISFIIASLEMMLAWMQRANEMFLWENVEVFLLKFIHHLLKLFCSYTEL